MTELGMARRPLPRQSILRRSILAVLLIEIVAAMLLIAVTASYEQHVRFRAFDVMLYGRASALLGAVQEAAEPSEDIALDATGLDVPAGDLYEVVEDAHTVARGPAVGERVLGRSRNWPESLERRIEANAEHVRVGSQRYRFVAQRGVRLVDPEEKNGGTLHHVTILYGASTGHVRAEVLEAVRFYAITFALVLLLTTALLAWLLRRALSPLNDLTAAAGRISAQAWRFAAPQTAWQTRELAPLTAAIEASIERLQQSFRQQRRFTSDAAHELKTDVAIIKSSLQLLTMRPRSAGEYRQGLELCLADCERLEEAVLEMLTLARVEHGAGSGEAGAARGADLTLHAREAAQSLTSMAELRGVELRHRPAEAAAPVALSTGDCELLCTNLLQNAIQHSRPGDAVTVSVRRGPETVSLTVEDQGEGIAPETLPHIFEPFYRGDDARDRKRGGTGLGLAICKALCEKAGGSIDLRSESGRGTVVTVELPARDQGVFAATSKVAGGGTDFVTKM